MLRIAISIHTSAKEVTCINGVDATSVSISIHTSAKEVTQSERPLIFQLRISIHTSAKEVTLSQRPMPVSVQYFNPHFREGSDIVEGRGSTGNIEFQSTLPRRK